MIFVTNGYSGTIGEYTTSGDTINAALITGLNSPQGIVVSGSDLYVADYGNNRIGEYTITGGAVNASLISTPSPKGLALLGSDLLVTDPQNNRIKEYSSTGSLINANFITGVPQVQSMALNDSNIFVSDETVGVYSLTGAAINTNLLVSDEHVTNTWGIAASDSELFVVYGGGVGIFTTSGETVNTTRISGLTNAFAIALSGSDLFIGTDITSPPGGDIAEYTTVGQGINNYLVTGLLYPEGIAIMPDVPEPTSLVLLGCGVLGCMLRRRRKAGCMEYINNDQAAKIV